MQATAGTARVKGLLVVFAADQPGRAAFREKIQRLGVTAMNALGQGHTLGANVEQIRDRAFALDGGRAGVVAFAVALVAGLAGLDQLLGVALPAHVVFAAVNFVVHHIGHGQLRQIGSGASGHDVQRAARVGLLVVVVGAHPRAGAGKALTQHRHGSHHLVDPGGSALVQLAGGHHPQKVFWALVHGLTQEIERHLGLEHLRRTPHHNALAGVVGTQALHRHPGVRRARRLVLAGLRRARFLGHDHVLVRPHVHRQVAVRLNPAHESIEHQVVTVVHVAHSVTFRLNFSRRPRASIS